MIITSFKKSKRGNILIYADKKYFASIPDEVFIKQGFKIGGYIDEKILSAALTDINNYKAKERALNLLSFRAHSKKELEQKLKQKFLKNLLKIQILCQHSKNYGDTRNCLMVL